MNYLARLKQKQMDGVTERDNKFLVKQNKIQLQADILATEKAEDKAEKELEILLSSDALDSVKILDTQDKISKCSADRKALEKLSKELFD